MEGDAEEVRLSWGHDDDDSAFLDLLELIDSSHGELSMGAPMEATSTDDTPTTPRPDSDKDSKQRAKATPKRLPKDELEYLRGKVDELEAQLAVLRSRSTAKVENGGGTPERVNEALGSASVWETIALHQMDAKRKAEVENVRLRELLEGQLRVAHNLERVLRKRPIRQAESILKPKRFCAAEPADASQYDLLLARATARLAEVRDVVKTTAETVTTGSPFNDLTVDSSGKATLSIEYQNVRVLPFDVVAISDAYWKCFSMEIQFPNGQYTPIAVTTDSITARLAVTYIMRRSEVLVTGSFVLTRSIQDGCCLLTWESRTDEEASDHAFGGFKLLQVADQGWGLIQPCTNSSASSTTTETPASLLKSSARIDIEFVMQSMRYQEQVGTLTDVVLGAYSRAMGVMNQTTENLLMTAAVGLA